MTSDRPITQAFLTKVLTGLMKGIAKVLNERLATLEAEIAEFKARPLLRDAGIWRHGSSYVPGDVARFKGSPWVCTRAHTADGATADHSYWRLWMKSGKNGRDAR